MKKYITIIFLILLFACENDFHKEVNKYLTVETQQEKIDLVNGIYSRLVKVHNSSYFMALDRSDDINIYSSYSFLIKGKPRCGASGGDAIDYAGITGEIYKNLYAAIININNLLKVLTEDEDGKLIGELYFLRAYSYFKLARIFGTPPLVKDVDVNYMLPKPTYSEVYQFIEKDMMKAIDLLPDTYSDARIPNETPHKGTAKALLAEIYLTMAGYPLYDTAKYAEAARLSGEVIEKADFYNFALLPDFAYLWKETNRHNSENIFGLFFSDGSNETVNTIGAISLSYSGVDDRSGTLDMSSSYHPELKFYANYPENYRKEISFVTGYYGNLVYQTEDTSFTILKYNRYDPITNPCSFVDGVVCKKWVDINRDKYKRKSDNSFGSFYISSKSEVTLYLLRYAQTMLTYAEAKARSGDLDQSAFEMVNQIRRRANHVDLLAPSKFDLPSNLSSEQFVDSVVWERAWELAGEPEGRWFDIIRLNMKNELKNLSYDWDFPNSVSSYYLTDDWYFYLIPKEDRWQNPNYKNE
jgi:starch-binding outer membrane protein, SusD/RagB family